MSNNGVRPLCGAYCIDPRRLKGATGPTGPVGEILNYGGLYNNTESTILLTTTEIQVPMNGVMPSRGVITNQNTITVTEAGIYEINWFLGGMTSVDSAVTLAIRVNNVDIIDGIQTRTCPTEEETLFTGSIIVSLAAGSIVDMAISALEALEFNLNEDTSILLSVKRIGNI